MTQTKDKPFCLEDEIIQDNPEFSDEDILMVNHVKQALAELKGILFREAIERKVSLDDSSLDRICLSSIDDALIKVFGKSLMPKESQCQT